MNSRKLTYLATVSSITIWIIVTFLLIINHNPPPRVEYFSGADSKISPQAAQLRFRFNHLMDRTSVEKGWQITPSREGIISWSGRVMTWTSSGSLNYGEKLTVDFANAKDQDGNTLDRQTFVAETKPLTLSYLIAEGPDAGRVKASAVFSKSNEMYLTPAGYFVRDYAVSPDGEWIAFLANTQEKETYTDKTTFHLYLSNVSTKQLLAVQAVNDQVLDHLHWYPDSSAIAFSYFSLQGDAEGLEAYFPASQELTKLADKKARAYPFYFSPDGNRIAYVDTNGALILGDMPDGSGDLITTTFNDVFGFDTEGKYLGYILPNSLNAFDLNNNPVLLESNGQEHPLPFADNTSLDVSFVNSKSAVVLTLEKDLGSLRDDGISMYDYAQNQLTTITKGEDGTDVSPVASPDGSVIVWQRFQNNNQGYVLTGWNDYRGILVAGEIFMKDLLSGELKSLGIKGCNVQFIP